MEDSARPPHTPLRGRAPLHDVVHMWTSGVSPTPVRGRRVGVRDHRSRGEVANKRTICGRLAIHKKEVNSKMVLGPSVPDRPSPIPKVKA